MVGNLTKHRPEKTWCSSQCVVVRPEDHPYPSVDSCVYVRDAAPTSVKELRRGVQNQTYKMSDPMSAPLLERVQRGMLNSPLTPTDVKAAIQRELGLG